MTPNYQHLIYLWLDLTWIGLKVTLPIALASAVAAWALLRIRRELWWARNLKAQGLCTQCTNPLPEGDKGPLCGECWAMEKAW